MSKILIVEDEHRIARFLQMELEHSSFQLPVRVMGYEHTSVLFRKIMI